jgi:hypothetical protein
MLRAARRDSLSPETNDPEIAAFQKPVQTLARYIAPYAGLWAVPIVKMGFVFFFYLFCSTFYVHTEGWTRRDAIYFITVTISTVGYGGKCRSMCLLTFERCFSMLPIIVTKSIWVDASFNTIRTLLTSFLYYLLPSSATTARHGIRFFALHRCQPSVYNIRYTLWTYFHI